MIGPSETAIEAACDDGHRDYHLCDSSDDGYEHRWRPVSDEQEAVEIRRILAAAHDPALGLDRSVCLSDVVTAAREQADAALAKGNRTQSLIGYTLGEFADFLERGFGGGA